jgi:hypothetical protein
MAVVREIRFQALERESAHTEASATYTIVSTPDGAKYLQIDTYGSSDRAMPGKKSQSVRFSPTAIAQLKAILREL